MQVVTLQGRDTIPTCPLDVGCALWFASQEYSAEKRWKGAFQQRSLTSDPGQLQQF